MSDTHHAENDLTQRFVADQIAAEIKANPNGLTARLLAGFDPELDDEPDPDAPEEAWSTTLDRRIRSHDVEN